MNRARAKTFRIVGVAALLAACGLWVGAMSLAVGDEVGTEVKPVFTETLANAGQEAHGDRCELCARGKVRRASPRRQCLRLRALWLSSLGELRDGAGQSLQGG